MRHIQLGLGSSLKYFKINKYRINLLSIKLTYCKNLCKLWYAYVSYKSVVVDTHCSEQWNYQRWVDAVDQKYSMNTPTMNLHSYYFIGRGFWTFIILPMIDVAKPIENRFVSEPFMKWIVECIFDSARRHRQETKKVRVKILDF